MSEPKIVLRGGRVQATPQELRQSNGVCLLAHEVLSMSPSAPTPGQVFVESATNDPLSTQIAEPNGLHTCDMTSTVNAFIWQGWLTGAQGKQVHDGFPTFQPDREFTRKVINDMSVLIASREEAAIEAITGEKLYGASLSLQGLSRKEVNAKVLGALTGGLVLNVSDGSHSRLAVGYRRVKRATDLWLANPHHPNELELQPIEDVVLAHESGVLFGVAKKHESMTYMPQIPFETSPK